MFPSSPAIRTVVDNMAPLSSTKQKRDKHSSANTRKDSSTPNTGNGSRYQEFVTEVTQSLNQQDYFNVPRTWSTWPDLGSLAQRAANIALAPNDFSSAQLTPMDRWRMETAQQSPWNNVAAVTTSSKRPPSGFGERLKDSSQGGDTDNGTWLP